MIDRRFFFLMTVTLFTIFSLGSDKPAEGQVRGSDSRGSTTQQGSDTTGSDQRGPAGRQAPFEAQFWNYLTRGKVPYRQWRSWPDKTGLYAGQSPHGAFLRMYINSKAAANTDQLADGSILVKENFGQDKRTLMAVTVMYKAKGYDAQHGDWYWVKYNPDGSVARTPREKGDKPIRGRFASCIQCHDSAAGDDFVFAND